MNEVYCPLHKDFEEILSFRLDAISFWSFTKTCAIANDFRTLSTRHDLND